jgi:hypothetical protein
MNNRFYLIASLASVILFTACSKSDTAPTVKPAYSSTQTLTVNFSTTKPIAFFGFKDSSLVVNTDSASAKWDFGLRFTNFVVNSNASGPGAAGVIMQDGVFANLLSAPSTGYAYDTTSTKLAIKDGSWYDYNGLTHAFVPKAGKVFFFRTADGTHYAKMQLLAVDYMPFTGPTPLQLAYKFQYVYQPNGGISF